MSKAKKNFLIFLGFIVLLAAVCGGLVYYSSTVPTEEEALLLEKQQSHDFEKYKKYKETKTFYIGLDKKTNSDKPGYEFSYDYIKPVIENIDSSYIWAEYYEPISYAVSKKTLKKNIDEYETEINELDDAIRSCKFLITNMTGKAKSTEYKALTGKKPIYWSYSRGPIVEATWRTMSAFKEVVTPEEYEIQGSAVMKDNILREKGLRLNVENPEVEKVMCIDWFVDYEMYYMMISADVTPEKKPDEFNKVSWLPDVGETKRVTFVIMTMSDKYLNKHFVSDLAVVGYN